MPLRYRPFTPRQHLLIVLLAIATAIIVVLMLTEQPGAPPRPQPLPAAAAGACAPGQSSGCVGGKLDVIIVAPGCCVGGRTMSGLPAWARAARAQWRWRGSERPAFAVVPGPGQVSVWDFPRPPRLVSDLREIVIRWGEVEVARTRRAQCVLETAHPPSFYLPWDDVARHLLERAPGSSLCEWKGPAQYWSLVDGDRRLPNVAWSYPRPLAGAEPLADCVAFYPSALDCRVDGAHVLAQPGGFYGGWITPELAGPFKGEPGSEGW